MAHSARSSHAPRKKPRIPPGVTLAVWRLRQTWRLLLVTGLGIVAAVTFVCTVPFYSDVTTSIGLRNVLTSSAQNSAIAVQSVSERLNFANISKATQKLHEIVQRNLGPYLSSSQFSIETQPLALSGLPCPAGSSPSQVTCDQMQLISAPIDQAVHHITMAQGRLPQPRNDGIEIAITAESAARLKVHPGSILTTTLAFAYLPPSYLNQLPQRVVFKIALHVVGIFLPPSINDPFWHGTTYLSSSAQGQKLPWFFYTGLTSSNAYLSYISRLAVQTKLREPNLEEAVTLTWYYNFDASHIAIYNLDDIETGLYNTQTDIGHDALFNQAPFLEGTKTATPSSTLDQFKNQIAIVQIPLAVLTVLVLSLVLFFVSMMANLLVESQSQVIALLRSRGASRRQLFSSFITQCIWLGFVAILLGPLLAIAVVYIVTPVFLPAADQEIRTIIFNESVQVVSSLGLYALITAAVAIATVMISIGRSLSLDILSLRRESARPTYRTLWQRLNLDFIAIFIAVVGYFLLAYFTKISALSAINAQLHISLLAPLTLLVYIFVFIAGILLFLRLFPALLYLGARFTTRRRSAVPMLAMMQMSRTPRQAVRLTLLLMLATIFTIFSTTFIATQSQRISDVAAYQAGADFSGTPAETSNNPNDLPAITSDYKHIPGVISATLGYKASYYDVIGNTMDVQAVDADTFAQTAIWNEQESAQPLSSLMAHLVALRDSAATSAVIPVYVDAAAWQTFDLGNGPDFTLNVDNNNDTLNFVA
ncbi:MAG: ABC transporter permease, partial [Ktedonobacteraceae bacterium]